MENTGYTGESMVDPTGAVLTITPIAKRRRKITLQLPGESKTRSLGTLDIGDKSLKVRRTPGKHTLRVNDSYGFNHHILANAKLFEDVLLSSAGKKYRIPRIDILEKGDFLHFKTTGFERQIFLPKSVIAEYEIKKEKRKKKPVKAT